MQVRINRSLSGELVNSHLHFTGGRKSVLVSWKGMKGPEPKETTLDRLAQLKQPLQTQRVPMKVMVIT